MLVVARLGHGDDRKNAHEQQEQCRKKSDSSEMESHSWDVGAYVRHIDGK